MASVSRCRFWIITTTSPFDQYQTGFIVFFELPTAVLELPNGIVTIIIINFVESVHVQLTYKTGYISMFEVVSQSLTELFTGK